MMSSRIGVLAVTACLAAPVAFGRKTPPVSEVVGVLGRLKPGDAEQPLRAVEALVARATNDPARRREVADALLAVLTHPGTSRAVKVFLCGQLSLVASDEHVGRLATLLAEPDMVEPARRALAGIPGEASGKVLRAALAEVKGPALVGVINSLGDRRDAKAVEGLSRLVSGTKRDIANAAVRALGEVGTPEAAAVLARARRMSNVLAGLDALLDAQLRCAENLAAAGHAEPAEAAYRAMLGRGASARLRIAALSGLVRVARERALPDVLRAMGQEDARLRATALRLARRVPGPKATGALVEQLDGLSPPDRALLIGILGERGDRSAAAAVAKRLGEKDEAVRVAAARATGALGDAASVAALVRLAATDTRAVQGAARASLSRLRGPGVDRELAAAAGKGEAPLRVEAIRALASRRAPGAGPTLIRLAADPDQSIRVAAFEALALAGGPGEYPKLLDLIVSPPSPPSAAARQAAEKAALAIGGRTGDLGGRNQRLLAALKRAPATSKPPLLRLLSVARASEPLRAVREHVGHPDAEVADAAVRALANWSTVAAAGDLLELARSGRSAVHRALALRGYLRLARGAGAKRLAMLRAVRAIATTAAAKRLLLSALGDVPDAAALELTVSFLDDGEVRKEAAAAALKIGRALLRSDRAAVRAGMETFQAKVTDARLLAQGKALHAEALRPPRRAGSRPIRADKKRSEARKAELAKAAPKGYRLACYLDCGPDFTDGRKGAPTLRVLACQQHAWPGSDRIGRPQDGTVHFAGREVSFEIAGLGATRAYRLAFSWWDFDHDARRQSVWLSAGKPAREVKLLGPTKLPSYAQGRKLAGARTLLVPREMSAFGTVRVTFRNEGNPNVVVSEVWLWESEAESAPAKPMPPQAPPRGKPAAGPAKRAKRATKPVPLKPGKKAAKRVLIVTGIDYPGHKWRLTAPVLAAGLDKDPRLAVEVVETPAFLASPKLGDYDVIVLHFMNWQQPDPGPAARENLRKAVAGGKGLVLVHFACGAFQGWKEFARLAGRAWNPKLRGHDPRGGFRVRIVDADHPVTRGLKAFETHDELYTCLAGEAPIRVLAAATSKVDKKDYPMAFVLSYGTGRVFHSVLGHDVKAFGPAVLELYRRGTAWSAGLEPAAKP